MVRQFRTPVDRVLLEIPAGGVENGEYPEDCVRRELQEEIGYMPGKLQRLGGFYAAPGYCSEYLHVFLATQLTESRLTAEDTDEIEVVRVPVSRVMSLIEPGDLRC
jgi:ADP-ribose pyrophosphatase